MTVATIGTEVRSIASQSAIYIIGLGLSQAVGFLMLPVYTRYLGPTDYGALELIELLTGLLGILLFLEAGHAMPQFYYAEKAESARNQVVVTMILGMGVLSLPLVLGALLYAPDLAGLLFEDATYTVPFAATIVAVWFTVQGQICLTYLRMRYMAKAYVVATTAQLIIALSLNIYFVVDMQLGVAGICYSTLISQSCVATVLVATILVYSPAHPSWRLFFRVLMFGMPLVPVGIATTVGVSASRFFLRYLASPDPIVALTCVGLFSLGNRLSVIVNRLLTIPFNSFWLPRCRDLLHQDEAVAARIIGRIATYSTFLCLFLGLLIAATSESAICIIAGPDYHGAHVVVSLLTLGYALTGLENVLVVGVSFRAKTGWGVFVGCLSLISTLVASYLLIPPLGIVGAALANLTSCLLRLMALYVLSLCLSPIRLEGRRLLYLLGTAVVLYFVTQMFTTGLPLTTFFVRAVLATSYPLVLLALGFYHESELVAVRSCYWKMRCRLAEGFRGLRVHKPPETPNSSDPQGDLGGEPERVNQFETTAVRH